MKEQFPAILTGDLSPEEAGILLDRWCARAQRSRGAVRQDRPYQGCGRLGSVRALPPSRGLPSNPTTRGGRLRHDMSCRQH
jgi:hypothetical protein